MRQPNFGMIGFEPVAGIQSIIDRIIHLQQACGRKLAAALLKDRLG